MFMLVTSKIKTDAELLEALEEDRANGLTLSHCHGVFDLIHPGHVKYLEKAKQYADRLIVTITADKYVNKGPHRPAFNQQLRAECIAALECVNYVYINHDADAVELISKVKPNFYCKGIEYQKHEKDITGKIGLECNEVQKHGGVVVYTNEVVFSSSTLLNTFFSEKNKPTRSFLNQFKLKYTFNDILDVMNDFKKLNVLVIGDAIIDEYVYCSPLGLTGKGLHMVAKNMTVDAHIGGACVIANHLSSFVNNVELISLFGEDRFNSNWIKNELYSSISTNYCINKNISTLTKRRYVTKDGPTLTKLFETYSSGEIDLNDQQTEEICNRLVELSPKFDLVLVADFGNGFINDNIRKCITTLDNFTAINTQINSGNRGYHVVSHYGKANYVSLNEAELRLTTHNRKESVEVLTRQLASALNASNISITQGAEGVLSYNKEEDQFYKIPCLSGEVIDRVGAGDCFLALSSLGFCQNLPNDLSAVLGSVAASLNIQTVGNSQAINRVDFLKYLTTLMK